MKKYILILALLALVGCVKKEGVEEDSKAFSPNQCVRSELFQTCMKALPAGPERTKYNDWDEVVSECGSQAYYQSLRLRKNIPQECRAE